MSWAIAIPQVYSCNYLIDNVTKYVLDNLNQEIVLKDLAKSVNVSTYYLCRIFKKHLGISPMRWLWLQRTLVAASYLRSINHFNLTDIAFACGFSSSAHFSRYFKSVYEICPRQYRKMQCDEQTGVDVLPAEMKGIGETQLVKFSSYNS
jgi:AraC-like DNA-binding protein